ncbi:hypothetical protein H2204_007021 [Knufia peltigerae]|nr:hypothetical protein H2204_007021 [Knufia peltigerae]
MPDFASFENGLSSPFTYIFEEAAHLDHTISAERFPTDIRPDQTSRDISDVLAALDEDQRSQIQALATLQDHQDDSERPQSLHTGEQVDLDHQTSLESIPDAFSFYIGPTGTSDIYLLRRQTFLNSSLSANVASGIKFQLTEKPDRRSNLSDQNPCIGEFEGLGPLPPTIFGVTDNSLVANAEPRESPEVIKQAWSEFWALIEPDVALRLVRLYLRFIEPQFPILFLDQIPNNQESLGSMNLALLAGMCAIALPFALYDEALYRLQPRPPSSQQLYRICWLALWHDFHAPTLVTIQSCLIFQHRLPTNPVLSDTAFKWTLMASAVAAAHTVGLHRDPTEWHLIPLNECKLRRRLWWALVAMEKWHALARGMPSHIRDDESDVQPLQIQDLSGNSDATEDGLHFFCLVTLTSLLSEIQNTFYTVRAIKTTANDLHTSLDLGRSIRIRLQEWKDGLPDFLKFRRRDLELASRQGPPSEQIARRLDSTGSLHLSYITAHMTLFRALLRPLDLWTNIAKHDTAKARTMYDIALAVVRGALLCVRELVEFMEDLTNSHWNAFWHSWSRPNFAMAGTFMVHLLQITSPDMDLAYPSVSNQAEPRPESLYFIEEHKELQTLIQRWRWANRSCTNNAAGARGLTNLGLFKVETLLSSLGISLLAVESD